MRILLINTPFHSAYKKFTQEFPPLGIAYIAGMLRKSGHDVHLLDLNASDTGEDPGFRRFDLIGISADTPRHDKALALAAQAREHQVPVALGGPHVSFLPEESLKSGYVDYVVRGEGEYPMLYLAEFLAGERSLEDVPAVSYLLEGEAVHNPDQCIAKDIDSLPFPARDLLPMDKYRTHLNKKRATSMISSRGCPFNCSFCASSQLFGARWRAREPEAIVDEIEHVQQRYQVSNILFVDDNFTLDPQRTVRISELICKKDLNIQWLCFSRVNTIVENEDMVQGMAESGVRMMFLGVESPDPRVLESYNKKITAETSFRALEILKKYSIDALASFIIGNLNEDSRMIKNTIRFANKLNPKTAQFSILTPYPGTRLYNEVKDRILTFDWSRYDGMHATIKPDRVRAEELERLIKKAYVSFYLHPGKILAHPVAGMRNLFMVPRLLKAQSS